MKLLASQKNDIIQSLIKANFSYKEFDIIEGASITDGIKIIYKKKPTYNFHLTGNFNRFRIDYSPGQTSLTITDIMITFLGTINHIGSWANYLKRELEAEDILEKINSDINDTSFDFNDETKLSFSATEKKEVKSKINTLKLDIINLNLLSPSELKLIEDKLSDLERKLDDLNKFDWRTFCIGTFMSLLMQLTLSPETGKTLWHLFLQFITSQLQLK